jgi:hypothetical protein
MPEDPYDFCTNIGCLLQDKTSSKDFSISKGCMWNVRTEPGDSAMNKTKKKWRREEPELPVEAPWSHPRCLLAAFAVGNDSGYGIVSVQVTHSKNEYVAAFGRSAPETMSFQLACKDREYLLPVFGTVLCLEFWQMGPPRIPVVGLNPGKRFRGRVPAPVLKALFDHVAVVGRTGNVGKVYKLKKLEFVDHAQRTYRFIVDRDKLLDLYVVVADFGASDYVVLVPIFASGARPFSFNVGGVSRVVKSGCHIHGQSRTLCFEIALVMSQLLRLPLLLPVCHYLFLWNCNEVGGTTKNTYHLPELLSKLVSTFVIRVCSR